MGFLACAMEKKERLLERSTVGLVIDNLVCRDAMLALQTD